MSEMMECFYSPVGKFNYLRTTLKTLTDAVEKRRFGLRVLVYKRVMEQLYQGLYGVDQWISELKLADDHLRKYSAIYTEHSSSCKMEIDYIQNSRDIKFDHLVDFGFGRRLLDAADRTGYLVMQGYNQKNRTFAWVNKKDKVVVAICISDERVYRYMYKKGDDWSNDDTRIPLLVMSAILKEYCEGVNFNFSNNGLVWTNVHRPEIVIERQKVDSDLLLRNRLPDEFPIGLFELAKIIETGSIPDIIKEHSIEHSLMKDMVAQGRQMSESRKLKIRQFIKLGEELDRLFRKEYGV